VTSQRNEVNVYVKGIIKGKYRAKQTENYNCPKCHKTDPSGRVIEVNAGSDCSLVVYFSRNIMP